MITNAIRGEMCWGCEVLRSFHGFCGIFSSFNNMSKVLIKGWGHGVGMGNLMNMWGVSHDEIKRSLLGDGMRPCIQGVLCQG